MAFIIHMNLTSTKTNIKGIFSQSKKSTHIKIIEGTGFLKKKVYCSESFNNAKMKICQDFLHTDKRF